MKHINLTQMLQGCSKRNGMTVSASMHDGGQSCDGNRQSRLMLRQGKRSENEALSSTCLRSALVPLSFRSRYLRYAAVIFCVLVMSVGQVWGTVVSFSATNLNAPAGRTIGSISLSSSSMTYDNTNGFKAGSSNKSFTLTANGGATISQVVITMTGTSDRYPVGSITNCTSSTRSGSVYTCTFNSANSATFTNNGGSVTITRIDVTYSGGTSTKRIYMKCGDSWCNSTPRFFAHSWGSADNDLELYAVDGCDPAVYYADIPSSNTSVVFTRQRSSSTGILWSGSDFWNKSEDITINTNNLFTCTGWNKGVTGTFSGSVAALSVTYNANGATGSAPTDANSYGYGATVTVLGKNTLTKADNMFIGWNTEDDGTGTWYAPGETFAMECANVTLYAQWATELDLKYVWKAEGTFCDDQSTTPSSIKMISTNDYFTLGGSNYVQESGSLNVAKSAGNYFLLTAKSGYQIKSVCIFGKIEDSKAYKTTDNSNWSSEVTSTNTGGNDHYSFENINSTYFGLKSYASKGFWIRNMVITIAPAAAACGATQPGAIGKGTLSGCTMRLTASGSPASNNTWYWQASSTGTSTLESGATKDVTTPGTYYIRSYYSTGTCWSEAQSVTVSASDLTPVAPTALAASSVTAKGVTLTVTDAANTNDYEFYVSTSSSAPGGSTPATHSSNTKSITITNLYAGTTFYAWARAKCGSNESAWTALTGSNFTTSTVSAAYHLTNVTKTSGATSGIGGSTFTAVFSANTDYSMPTPVVTIDEAAKTAGTDYTWNAGTGTLTINANKINGDIDITLNSAPAAPTNVAITGNYHIYPGETLSLTATPTGGNGPKTYQWQKLMGYDWTDIDDETSNTYTKASVTTSDVGHYRCIVTCGGTASYTSGQFDVKCLQLYVYYNNTAMDLTNLAFTNVDATHAYASVLLGNSTYCYHFKVTDGCGNWWGNNGESGMSMSNHDNWSLDGNYYTKLWTSKAGTYRFNLEYNAGLTSYTMSVVYPSGTQAAGYNLYFANDETEWNGSKIYYRIGKSSHNNYWQMNLVPGTANLYKVTTTEYGGFEAWHIANNRCGDNDKSIYKTNTNDTYEASAAMMFNGTDIASTGLTVIPDTSNHWAGTGDGADCEFYGYNTVDGMKTDRVTISQPSNGTITVSYTREDGVASSFTAIVADMNEDLAHTVIITPTATPNEGYTLSGLTVNGAAHTSGNTYTVTGATTIAATFSPASYTVTLNTNDGTINAGNVTSYTYGTGATLPTNVTKDGYRFMGWYDNEGLTGSAVTTIANDATGNKTYWAKWAQVYTITNGTPANGTITISKSSAIEGEAVTISVEANTGYTFNAWNIYKTSDAGTTVSPAAASASTSFTMPAYGVTVDATFNAIPVTSITLNKTETALTYGGSTETLSVTSVLPANALNKTYTWSSSNDAVATVTSGGVVSPVAAGSCEIYATANDGSGVKGTCAVTVNKADLSVTATAGTATSVTHNSATLPFELSSTTGVASVTLKVYDASDDSEPVKTVSGVTAATSGSGAVTGLSASTTYYFTVTPIGDANHNDGAASAKSSTFTTEAAPSLTALVDGTLYKANGIFSGDIPTSDTYVGGISDNGKFFFEGSASASPHNSMKWKRYTSTTLNDKEFTAIMYFEEGATVDDDSKNPTTRAMKFILPSAGSLTIYYRDNNTGADKVKLNLSGSEPCWSSSEKGDHYATKTGLSAGTYYLYATAGSTGILGVQFDATAATYTVSASVDPAGYGTLSASSITDVASGTAISASSNVLTVAGKTPITATPASATAEYTYAFNNWTKSDGTALPSTVTADLAVRANFTRTTNTYTVTWKNYDGTTLETDAAVAYGATPTYDGSTPTKAADASNTYAFSGWSPAVGAITGNTIYTAQFTPTPIDYAVSATLAQCAVKDGSAAIPATMNYGDDFSTIIEANVGFVLPSTISVTGVTSYTWNQATGALTLTDVKGAVSISITAETEGCTPQMVSKVVVTGSSAGTTSGYNEKEYVGTPVINVSGKTPDATNIDGESGDETGYKMSSDGNSIVFATLAKGTFQEGDVVKIGITRRNDTRVISSNKNVLTIYYGTNKDDADSLTTISTGSTTTSGASLHEGAGFYTYTLTAADVTKIGSKKGIGLFRASTNGENPYVYSVEIIGCRDWTTCTAPTAVVASSETSDGATLTVTDAANTDNYEFYINTSSTAPTAETTPTATSDSKTKVVSDLTASTTYYYWVRSDCGGYKSSWVAGTPATFTTEDAATTYSVTYNGNGSTGGSEPSDATAYEEGEVVTVLGNTGSLVKIGYTFVGWSTSATPSSGIFYPAGYKFTMGAANVTLYAVWGSTGATCVTLTNFETINHGKTNDNKPDSHAKYIYGYKSSTMTAVNAVTITTDNTNNKGQNSGVELRADRTSTTRIYANNTTTGGTPASFEGITSISFKWKFYNNSTSSNKSQDYTVKVGSTTVGSGTISGKNSDGYQTLTISGISSLNGYVDIILGDIGNSNNNLYLDDIQICYGSGAATGFDVTFNMNGHGSEVSKIENVPSGAKIGEPLPQPTATDYAFGGWYKEVGCTNEWNFGSNTITKDTTLFAKWTGCAPTISVHPSGTSYNQGAAATALSVTAATNDGGTLEYQWYSNESNSNSDGTEIPGATSASYTPSTALVGTIYYYCIVTNDCGNATSNVAAITVNDSKPNPTASWTIATPTHGGKGFSFSVTAYKNDGSTAWDGTLTAAMLSASADVVLSGVTVSDNTISGTYGVKASATSPVTFYLELPSTTNCAAATLEKEQSFTACSGTGVDGSTYEVPFLAKYSSSTSGKPSYYCESEHGYISPELGASSVSLASEEYDDFDYYINSGRSSVLVATKEDAVKKIQIYLNANGGAAQVTNVYAAGSYSSALKDYTAMTEKTDYTVSYTDEEGNTSIAKGKNGYIELAFTANLDEGTLIYVVLNKAAKYYGAKLTVGSGSGATIDTELAWDDDDATAGTVEKGEDDAEFTITATRSDADTRASLGEIRYSSSDTKIATVNATTGEVTIADKISFGDDDYKTTTIKATLVSSGCYKSAEINYTLQVNKSTCTEAAGTVAVTSESDCSVVLTVSGYEDGVKKIQWQKDGSDIPSATSTTYTATTSGTYTAVTTKDCARTSNSIVVTMSATATASKIVDSWYVKNGRRTPDIALVQTTGATSFTVKSGETTIWDEANSNTTGFGGCDFELKEDGIIYLHGTKSNGDAPSDLVAANETITVTVSGCGGALSGLDIIIKKQAETLKPSVAFVVDGTTRAKGGTATSVSTAKTSERPLWTYLSSSFDLTGCNIYWSVDSKELREYYSQYDAIVVTDDPNTQTTGAGGVEYVKAFGTLVDVRPILTMEAYVGRYTDGGWHVYNATPTSPNPRQVEMKLECKNHEIFAGVSEASDNVRSVTINGDDYWYITIVDTTQSPYKGTTKDYKDLPALQGFDPSSFSDMLGIGTIHDDALQAGVERQQEPAARMMILGIQNNAMGALTNEGKLIIKNAISYLLKTNMEEVDDCSNYFIGGTEGHTNDWTVATNWSKNSVPDFATKVRILAPVVIEDGQKVRASQVDIVVDGTSSKKDGELNGNVTINPGGALVVGGTVNRAFAPHYGIDDLEPTTSEDLIVQANADKSAALILDNSSGLTGATVQMYSSSFWELEGSVKKKYWSYVAVPIQEALIPDYFYGAFTYYYEEKSGWEKKWDGDYLYPFQGIGLSRDAAGIENFWGPLVSTENRDIKLTKTATGGGENLIANSWTAPIQIANFDADDFGDALATIYIYNTGNKVSYAGSTVIDANTTNQGAFTAGQWLGIPIGVAKLPEYTGLKVIPAMQTFEVDIPGGASNGTETTLHLDYDRLVRGVDISTDNLTEKLHAPKRSMNKNDGDVEAVMKVRVAGVHTLAEVWLIQDGAFGEGFDNGWEAYYAACDDRSPQLYAHSENGNMGIIAKQELEGTILGFAPSRDGADYTFSFYYRGDEELYLNDLLTETSTPITNEDTYSFTASNNGNSNRFIISRNPYQSPLITTGTEEIGVEGKNSAKKIIYNDKIYILYNGVIYDAMGKVINRK